MNLHHIINLSDSEYRDKFNRLVVTDDELIGGLQNRDQNRF